MLRRASELDAYFEETYTNKNVCEIWKMECSESLKGRFTENSSKKTGEV